MTNSQSTSIAKIKQDKHTVSQQQLTVTVVYMFARGLSVNLRARPSGTATLLPLK